MRGALHSAFLASCVLAESVAVAAADSPATKQVIKLDGDGNGKIFEGIGTADEGMLQSLPQ